GRDKGADSYRRTRCGRGNARCRSIGTIALGRCLMNRTIKQTKIVIAGGGFAGLYAARYLDKRLARRSDIEVTLVSRENFILFTPMLHEVAAGDLSPSEIVNPLRRILRYVNSQEAEIVAMHEHA